MSWYNRKKTAKQSKSPVSMLQNIATLTRMAKSGLLFIDMKEHKVVISATLATLFLDSREKWTNFLQNVQYWFIYKHSQMAWNKYFLDIEVKAVRDARKKFSMLTKLQEAEIRSQARSAVDIEAVSLPKVEPFDFIISSDISDGSAPQVYAVGRYDNGELDMVAYEDVQANQQ